MNRNVKVTCENCGTSVTNHQISRHKLHCSVGKLYSPKCPKFFTKSRDNLINHIAKKHSAAGPKNNHTCKESSIEFPKIYSLRHHKQRYHTAETTSTGEKAEMQSLTDAEDDKRLEEELQSGRHFLIDSETQKGRQSVFNFVVSKLTTQVIEEKLDHVLDKLKFEAKLNLALGFSLHNVEDGKIKYFYAHENNTLLE